MFRKGIIRPDCELIIYFSDKATKDAANKCCPADYMRHCMQVCFALAFSDPISPSAVLLLQAIEFQLRLNFRNKAAEREATICIQRELYSDDSLNVVSPKSESTLFFLND